MSHNWAQHNKTARQQNSEKVESNHIFFLVDEKKTS